MTFRLITFLGGASTFGLGLIAGGVKEIGLGWLSSVVKPLLCLCRTYEKQNIIKMI